MARRNKLKMYCGYAGKTLYIDLTAEEFRVEATDLEREKKYLGGFGSGYRLAYELIKPGIDPYSPENVIIMSPGCFVGTSVPGASRVCSFTKLPLINAIAWSNGGMHLGAMLKYAGYDHVIVSGKAKKVTYITINDGNISFCSAQDIWGKDIRESTKYIKKRNENHSVLCIGQAGENKSPFALAMIDCISTAGRGGLGAIMGSKNLKAIAVNGTGNVNVSDKKKLSELVLGLRKRFMKWSGRETAQGLGMMGGWLKNRIPSTCSREYMTDDEIRSVYGLEQYKSVEKYKKCCSSCMAADKEVIVLKDKTGERTPIPMGFFAQMASFGTHYAIDDINQAGHLIDLQNRYGLDSQAMELYIDFVLKLYENGVITSENVGGLQLKRGYESVKALIEKISTKKGIDDAIANGWHACFEAYGNECEQYAHIIKNQNVHWDPRLNILGTMEFAQIVSPKGPYSAFGGSPTTIAGLSIDIFKRHSKRVGASDELTNRIFNDDETFNLGSLTSCYETWVALLSCLGICNRTPNDRLYSAGSCAEIYSAVTGIKMNERKLMTAAERVWQISRAIIVRDGFTRNDDAVPMRWYEPYHGREGKPFQMYDYFRKKIMQPVDLKIILNDYYEARGWSLEKGIPVSTRLRTLDLHDVDEDMEKYR
jgi:aldehyde:ferredoxin oxidoreductase